MFLFSIALENILINHRSICGIYINILFSYLQFARVHSVSWMNDNENKKAQHNNIYYIYHTHLIMSVVLYYYVF